MLRNRKCLTTEMSLPECARPRAQQLTPTKTRDIFKHHAYHVAVAEDGHTPLVAKSHFGIRVQETTNPERTRHSGFGSDEPGKLLAMLANERAQHAQCQPESGNPSGRFGDGSGVELNIIETIVSSGSSRTSDCKFNKNRRITIQYVD